MQVEQHPRMKMSSELLSDQVTKLPKTEQQRTEQECHSVVPWSSCSQHLHHEDYYLNRKITKQNNYEVDSFPPSEVSGGGDN